MQDAAKNAAGKAVRHVHSKQSRIDNAKEYPKECGSLGTLNQDIEKTNELEALKEMRTTAKRVDQLRPSGQPLESTL